MFDQQSFEKNYDHFVLSFSSSYTNLIIGYSYKTNYLPYVCRLIKQKGGLAEVVSRLEYDLALKIGYDPRNIIFNGPLKRYYDIELALKGCSIINLDSAYEIGYIEKFLSVHPGAKLKVGLRININLTDNDGISYVQNGLKVGRFGFDPDELGPIIERLNHNNVKINCLHGHASTNNRSVENFINITQKLCDTRDKYEMDDIEYLDIGGGFFGKVPNSLFGTEVPSFDDYAQGITKILNNNSWVQKNFPYLIIEPGISMVANTLSFVTKVYEIKNISGHNFAMVDGSIYNVKPTMHPLNLPYTHISLNKRSEDEKLYDVVGSTCMEKDVLLKEVSFNGLSRGDYLIFDLVGAYTIVMTPPFINLAPPIVVRTNNYFVAIRRMESFDDFFQCYKIERL